MKIHKILFLSAVLLAVSFSPFLVSSVHAMTPSLSLSTSGQGGDYVQVSVTGDSGSSVFLFYGSYSILLGNLSSNGTNTFSVGSAQSENQTVSIPANATVYVKTGGINGTSSSNAIWPYVQNSTTTNNLTLSQGALLLNAGQTSTITASANYLYVLSNSAPAIANINLNANQITVTANTYGSTVADICVVGSTTNCASVNITVQNSSSQQLNFSQNNFSIVSGQSISVVITGGSGTYTLPSPPTSSSPVQASLNGSTIILTAGSNTGTASITVCTTDMSYCGILNVSSTTSNSTAITFSQTNPVVAIGQSTTVTIYGGTGNNFYVSSNSNPSIVQANINGNILTLIGNQSTGTSTISVCAYAGSCGSIVANVSSLVNSGSPIALSQSTISILAGQSSNITISGGSTPYSISAPSAANIFNGVVNGNVLTIYGVNPGSATINVCASAGCTTLNVTINSVTSSVNPPTFSQNNVLMTIGQQTTVYVSGNGGYYISNNSNSAVASEQISGSSIIITAIQSGAANLSICQSGGQCASLYLTVSGSSTTNAAPVLSQTSLSLTPGQSSTVSVSGLGNYYIGANSGVNIASATINSNTVTVSAIAIGATNISICQSGGLCSTLYVTVSGTASNGTQLVLSQTSLTLNPGQTSTVYVTGNGNYYVSNNPTPSIATVQVNGSSVSVVGVGYGTDVISICQSDGQCAALSVSVSNAATTPSTVSTVPATTTYVFPRYLGYKDKGADVLQLQKLLASEGFLSATPNGNYGPATIAAVKKFQKANGIKQTGDVGPSTKNALNKISVPATASAASTNTQALQQEIQQLLAQVSKIQGQ